ncbi:sphingomyelin phosphodiesterase 5 isoform X1 [Oryctolagus cuniculus]|uniref:sphingomyelin phosphodiesterase 5 isoform X1 n=1 Tax=Oryctolagus cuniculus TaxID=9986 RepID=UPI00387939C9
MQPLPDWPPAPDALRASPFPHPVLHALHDLSRALLFPTYWLLDQLLGCCAPRAPPSRLGTLRAAAVGCAALALLLLLGLPLALPGLLLWLPLQAWRRPFCYQPPPRCWVPPPPWRAPAEPARCFVFLTANLCLLPDGLARFSNLSHSQRRAEAIGAALLAGLRPSLHGATECRQPQPGAPCGVLLPAVPAGVDFVCLQEVFDLRAGRRLVRRLAPSLGPVLHDVGTLGLQRGPYLKLLGSGLLLASRYPLLRASFRCFPNARREDALASKGLLSAQAQLGTLDGRRIVGFLHCTHLHAPTADAAAGVGRAVRGRERPERRGRGLQRAPGRPELRQPLARPRSRAGAQTLQPLPGPLPAGHAAGAALGPGDLIEHHRAPPLGGQLPGDAVQGPGAGERPPTVPGGPSQRGLPAQPVARPASGLHRVPGTAWGAAEPGKCRGAGRPGLLAGPSLEPESRPQEVEQVTFSTALAGLTDHLAVGLHLRVSAPP